MKWKKDRKKEIDAFNELKRRGKAQGEPNETDISMGNYSRRLADIENLEDLRSVAESVLGKKHRPKNYAPHRHQHQR